ncbi:glycosyl hydrolase family 2, sugar binding domain protein with Fibronectin type III domain [Bifidobacterium actinocoloniiforme DSM 22766]|uniref:Glycosyl hydrolase family 2, sugar binding domain protein with Fibronectin type III domain n=1 Tax=Bifidobacterium actinocoloniiforme DSM 22766 TaxID=1437605 RepID=A0A086Z2K1_9BIFI|nr:fibronectin type III domain-containing protein [Bifidobacterium actinocoloniiforme]AKV55733.1 hypothetical protein AB656_05590 [Bifidobacterium actinocoloniiforme DSM 22766]KFI40751.1 glycosyl hydrolase family 2, sugar binding domain protein with Fibronectin type III domain [Bifidobacterium actinocoloniiforme DSM 22766]
MELNLNGSWNFYPDGSDEGHKITVPTWWDSLPQTTGYPAEWSQGVRHGLYRRSFQLSKEDLAEDLFVHVGALATLGKVRVNGVSVGPESTKEYLMTLLPYDLDINGAARTGSNELEIEVWSVKQLPEDALAPEEGPDRLLFPFGTENIVGRVGLGGDVRVASRPKLRIDDMQIIPDLKRNADPSDDELTLKATLVNHTRRMAKLALKAQVRPWTRNERATESAELTLESGQIELAAGASQVISLTAAWPDARYWSRTDPFLYQMDAELIRTTSGIPVNTASDRFGFRQFWREGDRYMMNGLPIRLRGDSLCLLNQGNRDLINEIGDAYGVILDDNHASDAMAEAWIDAYRHANANILRNHIRSIPSDSLENHADETGMLIEEETAFWNPGSVSNVSLEPPYYINYSDETIGYYCEWVQRWVRAYRNHPSIILWSTTNEAWNPNDATELIGPLQEAALREDPSRLVINDGFNKPITNEDSRHYFGGYPSGMTSAPDIYSLYQIDSDLPLAAGEEFSVSTAGIPRYSEDGSIQDIYHGRLNGDPDTITRADFGREVGRVTRGVRTTRMADWKPFCLSMFIYDNIERFVPLDQKMTKHGLNPKLLMRPQFDPTKSGDERWIEGGGYRYFANSYADVAAYDKAYDKEPRLGQPHRIYRPGETSERIIIVHNDEERRGTKLELQWRVSYQTVSDGNLYTTEEDTRIVEVPHAEHRESTINIQVPDADAARGAKLILTLAVRKENQEVYREENFLGWIDRPAPAKLAVHGSERHLGELGWESRTVKHVIHLAQEGGTMSEHWTATVDDDASGAFQLEARTGNLRHEQDIFYTLNTAALEAGSKHRAAVTFTGENGETARFTVAFTVNDAPGSEDPTNLAAGARVRVSSTSGKPGWTAAALVDGVFNAGYDRFGWSSEISGENKPQWAQLEFHRPVSLAQVVLVPRGENPGGTVAEAFHGEGEGVGGVLEFAAGHKALDPNRGQGFPLDFTISVSENGHDWQEVSRHVNYPLPDNGKPRSFDFEPVQGVRFVRIAASRLRPNPNAGGAYAMQLTQIAAYADHRIPTIPTAPTQVRAQSRGHQLDLSWSYNSDGRSPLTGSTLKLVNEQDQLIRMELDGAQQQTSLRNVPYGSWIVLIQGRNTIGAGELSEPYETLVGETQSEQINSTLPRPDQPSAEVDVDRAQVNLTWKANNLPNDIEGWNLILSPISGDGQALTAWAPANEDEPSWTFEQVPTGSYRAWLEATSTVGAVSEPSQPSAPIIVAHTPAKPNKPGVTSSGRRMKVTWQVPTDGGTPVTSYVLTLRNLTEGKSQVVKADASQTVVSVDALAPGNYTVSIIAVNAIGMSQESSPSLPCIIK